MAAVVYGVYVEVTSTTGVAAVLGSLGYGTVVVLTFVVIS